MNLVYHANLYKIQTQIFQQRSENYVRFLVIRKISHECYSNTFIYDVHLLTVNINYCVNSHVFESNRFSIRNLSLLAECHLMVVGLLDRVATCPRILSAVIENPPAAAHIPTNGNCSLLTSYFERIYRFEAKFPISNIFPNTLDS